MLLFQGTVLRSGARVECVAGNPFRVAWPTVPPGPVSRTAVFAVLVCTSTSTLHLLQKRRSGPAGTARPETSASFMPLVPGEYEFHLLEPVSAQRMPRRYMLRQRRPWTLVVLSSLFPLGLRTLLRVAFTVNVVPPPALGSAPPATR